MEVGGRVYVTNKGGNWRKTLGVKEKPLRFALRQLLQKSPENLLHNVSVGIWIY